MLTSSDAKFRCMWLMFVWSILLTLMSQFLDLRDHIPFYIFAAISVLVLPILTAVYSNTSGRHGAGLVRAGYVFCDPVLACITVTPVLLLNHLPALVDEYNCLRKYDTTNKTLSCMANSTDVVVPTYEHELTASERSLLIQEKKFRFNVIEASIGVPIVLVLLMGRRTRKMKQNTFLLCFCYWLVTGIEAADLLDIALLGDIYKHTIYTTEAIICIVMIITNSYAIVTLCSYISPTSQSNESDHKYDRKFDFLYKVFVSAAGVFFAEIPLLVARFQILAANGTQFLSATFFMWLTKDTLFIALIIFSILVEKFGNKAMKIPCKFAFDNTDVVFQPEKRDMYIIHEKCVRFRDPPVTPFTEKESKVGEPRKSSLKQKDSENANQDVNASFSKSSRPASASDDSPIKKRPVDHTVGADNYAEHFLYQNSFQNESDRRNRDLEKLISEDNVSENKSSGARIKQVSFQVGVDTPSNSAYSKEVLSLKKSPSELF